MGCGIVEPLAKNNSVPSCDGCHSLDVIDAEGKQHTGSSGGGGGRGGRV